MTPSPGETPELVITTSQCLQNLHCVTLLCLPFRYLKFAGSVSLLNTPEGSRLNPQHPQHPVLLIVSPQAAWLHFPHLPVTSHGFSSYTPGQASGSDPGQAEMWLSSPLLCAASRPRPVPCPPRPPAVTIPLCCQYFLQKVEAKSRKLPHLSATKPTKPCMSPFSLQLHKVRKSPLPKRRRVIHSTPEPVHVS